MDLLVGRELETGGNRLVSDFHVEMPQNLVQRKQVVWNQRRVLFQPEPFGFLVAHHERALTGLVRGPRLVQATRTFAKMARRSLRARRAEEIHVEPVGNHDQVEASVLDSVDQHTHVGRRNEFLQVEEKDSSEVAEISG